MNEQYVTPIGNEVDKYGRVIPVETWRTPGDRDAETGRTALGGYLTGAGHEVAVTTDDNGFHRSGDDRYTVENDGDRDVLFEAEPHSRAIQQEATVVDAQTRTEQSVVSQAELAVDTLRTQNDNNEGRFAGRLKAAENDLKTAEKRLDERTGVVAELFYELRKDAPDYFDNLPTAEYIKIAKEYCELLRNRDRAVSALEQREVRDALSYIGSSEEYINGASKEGYSDGKFTQQALHDLIYMRAVHEGKDVYRHKIIDSRLGRIDLGYPREHAQKYALSNMGEQPEEVRALEGVSKRTMTGIQVAEMYLAAFNALKKPWDDDIKAADDALTEFQNSVAEKARGSASQTEQQA